MNEKVKSSSDLRRLVEEHEKTYIENMKKPVEELIKEEEARLKSYKVDELLDTLQYAMRNIYAEDLPEWVKYMGTDGTSFLEIKSGTEVVSKNSLYRVIILHKYEFKDTIPHNTFFIGCFNKYGNTLQVTAKGGNVKIEYDIEEKIFQYENRAFAKPIQNREISQKVQYQLIHAFCELYPILLEKVEEEFEISLSIE